MKISVIIPVYNVEEYIERCIQSILSQTLQDFEIVVVNDASPDNSMDIVRKYAKSDNRIKIFENTQNCGLMWTRKEGIARASGDYFMFCDSDDYLQENALEVLYNAALCNEADIVIGRCQIVYPNKTVPRDEKLSYGTDSISVYRSLMKGELHHNLWAKIYKRTLFDNYKYDYFINHPKGEDALLFYQIVRNVKKSVTINDIVYNYLVRQNSISYSKLDENKYRALCFVGSYIFHILKTIDNLSTTEIEKYFISLLVISCRRRGFIKPLYLKYSSIENIEEYFRWKTLSHYYSGFSLIYVHSLLNNKFLNKVYCCTEKIIKKIRK